jgi:Holliday junction resolvase RusA-like endonuclease
MLGDRPFSEPIHLDITFVFPRPAKHFTKKGLRPDAPHFFYNAPDTDKLLRAIGDAGTGILWKDDKLIVSVASRKIYGENPGASVTVELADAVIHG